MICSPRLHLSMPWYQVPGISSAFTASATSLASCLCSRCRQRHSRGGSRAGGAAHRPADLGGLHLAKASRRQVWDIPLIPHFPRSCS
jgi:hypothetical protein